MGITNTFANIAGFLAPQVVGWLTDKEVSDTVSKWYSLLFRMAQICRQ